MGYRVCKYCIAKYGIKGSELREKHLETDKDLANHIEEVHGIVVIGENETEEQAVERCAKKGIVADRSKCQCQECKELREKERWENATKLRCPHLRTEKNPVSILGYRKKEPLFFWLALGKDPCPTCKDSTCHSCGRKFCMPKRLIILKEEKSDG